MLKGMPGKIQNSIFVDAERKYYTKVYNISSNFLVWANPMLLHMVNGLSLLVRVILRISTIDLYLSESFVLP